jgi:uncharacterized membrane protein (UPF0127 family)
MSTLRNCTTGTIIATRIDRLTGFLQRAVGLLARSRVQPDEGVWITRCNAIHTIGMRDTIDIIFVDRDDRVLRVEPGVAPNRWSLTCWGAKGVIELGGGALSRIDVLRGDRLELIR